MSKKTKTEFDIQLLVNKKRKRQSDWEAILVGNTYNWLTVISIEPTFLNGKRSGYLAVCQCKCGNITKVSPNSIYQGSAHSCGCYRTSKEFIDSQHAWQSDKDKFDKSKQKNRQFYIDHPEMISYLSEKNKEYWAANPDIVKSRADKHRQYYKDHPESRLAISEKRKQYFIDHPEKRAELSVHISEFYKNNPDKAKDNADKYRAWYNNNPEDVARMIANQQLWRKDPDKVNSLVEKRKQTLVENPDIQKNITRKNKEWSYNRRKQFINNIGLILYSDFDKLLDIIHPSHIEDLLNGNIKADSIVKTKCPVCGNYAEHSFNNVFTLGSGIFKYGHPLLCSKCNKSVPFSRYEQEISDYIFTFYNGELIRNSREIISPFELDLYYPEKKIAIEFNGDYWHNDNHKSKDYHYNKYNLCKEKHIVLVSIFESNWEFNQTVIKDYLFNLFNGKKHQLSYVDNNIMNNNYPDPESIFIKSEFIEDSYMINDNTVYTCGFSKLLGDNNGEKIK